MSSVDVDGVDMGLKREDVFKTEERVNLEGCNRRVVVRR